MHKQIACVVALMALTLGVGIFAGARQSMHSRGVDMILEQARQRAMTDNEELPVLQEKPRVTLHYPQSDPAAGHPILRWSRVDGAVMYDVQILKKTVIPMRERRPMSRSWRISGPIRRD